MAGTAAMTIIEAEAGRGYVKTPDKSSKPLGVFEKYFGPENTDKNNIASVLPMLLYQILLLKTIVRLLSDKKVYVFKN